MRESVMERPYFPAVVREGVQQRVKKHKDLTEIDRGLVGATIGALNKVCNGDEGRYAVLFFLFPEEWKEMSDVSTKTLSPAQWQAVIEWVGVYKDEEAPKGEQWKHNPNLEQEIKWIFGIPAVGVAYEVAFEIEDENVSECGCQEPCDCHDQPN